MDKNAKIYIAGHLGMAGSAIWRCLTEQGYSNLIGKSSTELNLTNQNVDAEYIPPFPSALNYDAKAWEFMVKHGNPGAWFWNVGGQPYPESEETKEKTNSQREWGEVLEIDK